MALTRRVSYRRLAALRNRFAGRRGFIVGNGPSLRASDLETLQARGEVTLACNKVFLIFPQTTWRPTAYVIEDQGVAEASARDLGEHFAGNVIYADYLEGTIPDSAKYAGFRLRGRVPPPQLPEFAEDFADAAVCGGTVTYSMLQLARWLGLAEVYLLGVDFNYALPGLRASGDFQGFNTYAAEQADNYFVRDYIKAGERHIAPDLAASLCAFQAAQRRMEQAGDTRIFNATRGGKLEVFPRADIDAVLAQPGLQPGAGGERPTLPAVSVGDVECAGVAPRALDELQLLAANALGRDLDNVRLISLFERFADAEVLAGGRHGKVSLESLDSAGVTTPVLFMHPPARCAFSVPTNAAGMLFLSLAMHPEVWRNPGTGPCRFRVTVDGAVMSEVTIDVTQEEAARRWFRLSAPVGETSERNHRVELSVEGVGGEAFRWALWRGGQFVWVEESGATSKEWLPLILQPAGGERTTWR